MKIHVIILAGGVGKRMGLDIPKQYVVVKGKPVFMYSFCKFNVRPDIDTIVFVADETWHNYINEWISKEGTTKTILYAEPGLSRQHSVINGMKALKEVASEEDILIVHESVRPLFPEKGIDESISALREYDGAMLAVHVKDATCLSKEECTIDTFLPKEQLYSGQTPESFLFGKYYSINQNLTESELLSIKGTSEIAVRKGLSVKLIESTERNFKLTTIEDLKVFEQFV